MTIYIEITTDLYQPPLRRRAAYVTSPFEAKDDIKELPSRRWDPDRKRWVIPADDVKLATRKLHQYGYRVEIIGDLPQPASKSKQTWADDMFKAIPERFHAAIHKALSKVLHPDIGGDAEAMQALNAARDRHKGAA